MKLMITVFVFIFSIAFAYIPALWGDNNIFSGWSILLGGVGGILGVYVGVVVAKRWLQ